MRLAICKTLVWEFWAHSWRQSLLAGAGAIGFSALIYKLLSFETAMAEHQAGADVWGFMHFGLFWYVLFVIATPIMLTLGKPQQRYKLPASSFQMVTVPMFCAVITTFGLYAITAATLNNVFDAGWLIWGPGLFAVATVAWYYALLWSTSNSLGLQLAVGLASAVGIICIAANDFGLERPFLLQELTVARTAALMLVVAIAVGIGTLGVSRLRQGEAIPVDRLGNWISNLRPDSNQHSAFQSPISAQLWCEWAERGYVMPLITATIGVVAIVIACFVADAAIEVGGAATSLLWLVGLMTGLYLGGRSQHGEIGNFLGSRPLTDSQIGNAVLKNVTICLVMSAIIWVILMAILLAVTVGLTDAGLVDTLRHEVGQVTVPLAVLLALVVWATVGMVASLTMAGKNVMTIGVYLTFGLIILGLLIDVLHSPLGEGYWCCVSVFTVGLVLTGFVTAVRLRLIAMQTLVFAALMIGFATVMLGILLWRGDVHYPPASTPAYFAPAAAIALIPAPLAAAPLAVWWNRHR